MLLGILAPGRHRFGYSGYPEKLDADPEDFGIFHLGFFLDFRDFQMSISIPGILECLSLCTRDFSEFSDPNPRDFRSSPELKISSRSPFW